MERGYIKIYRSLFDNPVVCKDNDHLAVWIYLLCEATHKDYPTMFGGQRITLHPGQLTTGRKRIADKLKISESKVQRILKTFEIEQQIEQRTDRQCRLISIVNWSEYQNDEQRNEHQVNNDRTTSEQRVNTKQEHKNIRTQTHNNLYRDLPPDLVEALDRFKASRKAMRKPMTDDAMKLLIGRLQKMTNGDTKRCIYLLDYALERGWQTVYEPKEDSPKGRGKMVNFMDIEV